MRLPIGGVPERPKGSDCKSDVYDFEGSNPSPSTKNFPKRAWFNGRTSAFQADGAGSIPAARSISTFCGHLPTSKECRK